MAKGSSVFQASTRSDLARALALTGLFSCVVLVLGDHLYLGIWYYLAVPLTALGLGLLCRCPPWFLTGTTIGALLTLAVYALINAQRAEGLLALGHLFSLPGAAAGIVLGAALSRRWPGPSTAFALGLGGLLLGFAANQLVVCNTLMWCGPLSWSLA